jgi:hypothetical protein
MSSSALVDVGNLEFHQRGKVIAHLKLRSAACGT